MSWISSVGKDMKPKVDQGGEDLGEGGVDPDPLDQDKPDQDQGRDIAT